MKPRLASLDLLRGAMLVLIAINHSPFWIRKYTEEFVGFASAAEGFVFVSAFLGGMLFARREERSGFSVAAWSSLQRSFRIYQAHLLLLAFLYLLAYFFLLHMEGVDRLIRPIFEDPLSAGLAGLFLLFQPSLLDILPLYVVFSLLTPAAFRCSRYGGWATVLCLSWSLWFWSHFDLKENLFAPGRDLAFINPGAFDLFAWQAIWVTGLWLGQRFEDRQRSLRASWLTGAAAFLALFFFLTRWWEPVRETFITDANWWMFNKWQLGPLRVLNFAALAWLVSRAVPWLEKVEPRLHWFSLIGRHMLPVFCSQVAFSVLLNGVSPTLRDDFSEILGWLGLQITCAFGLAIVLENRAADVERSPPPPGRRPEIGTKALDSSGRAATSVRMVEPASSDWYLRKQGGTEAFGPITFGQLQSWAEAAQISPLDSVSPDGANWQRAPMLAELQMDWLIELGDGALYGPTTLGTLREFVRSGDITAESEIIDAVAGSRHMVAEVLFGPDLEPVPEPEPAAAPASAPPRAIGIKENLQQRIRDLEERLMEARREAQMWRERCERGWQSEEPEEVR